MFFKDSQPCLEYTLGIGGYIVYIHLSFFTTTSAHALIRYITQGAPAVLFSLTPLTIHGYMMMGTSHRLLDKIPFWLCVWLIAVHSFLSHKEFRFIFPVLPIAALYAGNNQLIT